MGTQRIPYGHMSTTWTECVHTCVLILFDMPSVLATTTTTTTLPRTRVVLFRYL